jgi:hypothetical protein
MFEPKSNHPIHTDAREDVGQPHGGAKLNLHILREHLLFPAPQVAASAACLGGIAQARHDMRATFARYSVDAGSWSIRSKVTD